MSTSFSVCVHTNVTTLDLARLVQDVLGVQLQDESDESIERYKAPFQGLWIAVYAGDDFDDDCGIRFSSFTHHIDVTRYAGEPNADVLEAYARALACLIGSRLHWKHGVVNVVVHEVSEIIATFSDDPSFGRL